MRPRRRGRADGHRPGRRRRVIALTIQGAVAHGPEPRVVVAPPATAVRGLAPARPGGRLARGDGQAPSQETTCQRDPTRATGKPRAEDGPLAHARLQSDKGACERERAPHRARALVHIGDQLAKVASRGAVERKMRQRGWGRERERTCRLVATEEALVAPHPTRCCMW